MLKFNSLVQMLVNHKILYTRSNLFRLYFIEKNNWGGGANGKIFERCD